MSQEATVELLSRFLDGDLPLDERERIEKWIETDGEVREIYEGLRGVRGSLAQLAEAAPPAHLGILIQRRVALEAERSGLWNRLEGRLRGWLLERALLPAFAVVLALAAMFYLLANGLARFERAQGPVILRPPPGSIQTVEPREIAGRRLVRRHDRWIDAALSSAQVDTARRRRIPAEMLESWIGERPELAPLVELGVVVIELDGEVIELVFATGDG